MSKGKPHVVIVGGGLAGMSAAAALCEFDVRVTVLESKRITGGRAGSFRTAGAESDVDYCQHVGMGCCTNLLHLLRKTEQIQCWECVKDPLFIGPGGENCIFKASSWLPAPLHLLPAFNRLTYLPRSIRRSVAQGIWKLMRWREGDAREQPVMRRWLIDCASQKNEAIDGFWDVILVSALGDTTSHVSVASARKVIIDGFLSHRDASDIWIPQRPLSFLFGEKLTDWLTQRGVSVRCGNHVRRLDGIGQDGSDRLRIVLNDGDSVECDHVILAVPWHQLVKTLGSAAVDTLGMSDYGELPSSPITGIHLWFDRPITSRRSVVLVGRLSQWLFRPTFPDEEQANGSLLDGESQKQRGHYHQVVVSASHDLPEKERVAEIVVGELKNVFPAARDAALLECRVVTDPNSVFSVRPGVEALRPNTATMAPNLWLAGDWIATGWPSTMESAVISGNRAAESVARSLGETKSFEQPPLGGGLLSRILIR